MIPGTDHAGIATQTVVEKHLMNTLKKRRKDFQREEFLSYIWQWKEEKQENIFNQLQQLGCSCDWSHLRFTMDEKSNYAVKVLFKKMFDDQLIYRGDYLVHWDPATQTALADDEVEYEERDSFLFYFRYPLKNSNQYVVIATTRPETMLGDTALAFSPEDPRYTFLKNQTAILPILQRELPIIEDPFVDPQFGTGVVKITPAHDFNDYAIALRHHLNMINIMTDDGSINEHGKEFQGLKMLEAREAIIKKMKKLHLIEKIEPYKLRVGVSYRSKAIIEPYLSKQWFVKMEPFKEKLINAVKEKRVTLIPSFWEETYFYWINNLRDWCISRQLWWGHQIPIWYHKKDPEKMICHIEPGLPEEVRKDPDSWYQDEDVLDTWFSSALWPFSTLGWPEKTPLLEKFYPNSLLVTGHDILFFWVARMILMGEYALKEIPFHQVFLHGLIYSKSYWREDTEGNVFYVPYQEKVTYDMQEKTPPNVFSKWEKMSKSKGNIIDPLEIIDDYGTDAMRMALASSVTFARQIDLDRRRFEEFKNFANKMWNATRFVLQQIQQEPSLTKEAFAKGLKKELFTLDDWWILSLCNKLIVKVNNYLDQYHFDKAASSSYKFFWDDFCAYYLEMTKPILFSKKHPKLRENKQKLLCIILIDLIRILHPTMPFITEEIFFLFKNHFEHIQIDKNADLYTQKTIHALLSLSCMLAPYPQLLDEKDIDEEAEKKFSIIQEIIRSIRNMQAEMQLPFSQKITLHILLDRKKDAFIEKNQFLLQALLKIEKIFFVEDPEKLPKDAAFSFVDNKKIVLPLPKDRIEKEIARLKKEKEKLLKKELSIKASLENKKFQEKAPKEIVKQMHHSLETTSKMLQEISLKIKKLR